MATPKDHIEEIRRNKFSIGASLNPLTEDLHQAVKNLSAELYAKDVHFLMEIIQNAEDNVYLDGVQPTLEFVITSKDITATGAPATLIVFNNERGFTAKNIESICSVGRSTKKGNRKSGYIGEKGIGFKSVFLITSQPYIFSHGYQIRFNEAPCPDCSLGFIVPEWVDENPILSNIKEIYGSMVLPTTVLVLPLKPDKVKPVKLQLSSIHPEVLLFLSKIKRLSVREHCEDPKLNTVSAIAIQSETDFETRKNMAAKSYTLRLSAEEKDCKSESECSYYMWQQTFPVSPENKVERRMDIDQFNVTLAFPNEERLHRGTVLPGVYAFLPTEMVTNFPFIIQSDFVLSSSRETIRLDDKWNRAILDCIPSAFYDAFSTLVKTGDDVPASALSSMFKFVPVKSSSYEILNDVREKIREKMVLESIIPIESYKKQSYFYKPCDVGRLIPSFWNILGRASKQGLSLINLSSHGKYILNSALDSPEYDDVLNFLGVKPIDNDWYAKCIQSCNLVDGVSEDIYLELLTFVADNWSSKLSSTSIVNVPLIKYVDYDGHVSKSSIKECTQSYSPKLVCRSDSLEAGVVSWLIEWNKELRCVTNRHFMPSTTQQAIVSFSKRQAVIEWLQNHAKVAKLTLNDFAVLVCNSIKTDKKLTVIFVHFLYHSLSRRYLSHREVDYLCGVMPLVDKYGEIVTSRVGVLVPANQSKWAELIVSNPWRNEGYIELGEDYLHPRNCAGVSTHRNELMEFLQSHILAKDIPHISPPNAGFSSVSGPLTVENAFLLLEWIHVLKYRGIPIPNKFLTCIKNGSWLRVTVSGGRGWRAPSESFMFQSSLGQLLQNGSVLVDIPLVDQIYYGGRMNEYEEELKLMGVMFSCREACEFIGKRLAASSSSSRDNVLSILNFIRFLSKNYFSMETFVEQIRDGRWIRTKYGEKSPVGIVLFDAEWRTAAQISDIPFIDSDYYGGEINNFKSELKLLGVVVSFAGSYQVIVDHLKPASDLTSMAANATLLMLDCIRTLSSSDSRKLVNVFKGSRCLKTNMGSKAAGECFLSDPVWGCVLEVFSEFPIIDDGYYGRSIFNYKNELKQVGVSVDFDDAIKKFIDVFKKMASEASGTKEIVLSFLSCFRRLKEPPYTFPSDFKIFLRRTKWLWTRSGHYSAPNDSILFGPEWASVSLISKLPFIDDTGYYYDESIHQYKDELQSMGVVTKFKDGVNLVAKNLSFPQDPSCIVPESVFSLLECIRLVLKENNQSLIENFVKSLCTNWLKTYAGYLPPDKCLLYDSKWHKHLHMKDGPFLDEEFYGSKIKSYQKELNAIGVTVDLDKGCSLVASNIELHSEHSVIARIYAYLSEYKWKPDDAVAKRIWIPGGLCKGKWVTPEECVVHDKDDLFSSRLNVLEKWYEKNLLPFFSYALDVKSQPSIDDYYELWKEWESSKEQLSHADCCKFWKFMLQHWNLKTERKLADGLTKLPAASGSDGIYLVDKRDVFIVDDLQLKNLFQEFSPLFVWYPQSRLSSLPRDHLLDIYKKIGVRTISEAVQMEEMSLPNGVELKEVAPTEIRIGEGLIKLILGFLASSTVKMEADKRIEAVKGLCTLIVRETPEPITVSYSLPLSSREITNVTANRMMRWERGSSVFFKQKLDLSSSHNLISYATYFAEAIAEGVLRDQVDHIRALSDLIRLAFILNFDEAALKFQMDCNNLQIFMEDEEFLSAAFHSKGLPV